jgi:hypothetical protein
MACASTDQLEAGGCVSQGGLAPRGEADSFHKQGSRSTVIQKRLRFRERVSHAQSHQFLAVFLGFRSA